MVVRVKLQWQWVGRVKGTKATGASRMDVQRSQTRSSRPISYKGRDVAEWNGVKRGVGDSQGYWSGLVGSNSTVVNERRLPYLDLTELPTMTEVMANGVRSFSLAS
jgi:hypothetical protein